MMRSAGRCYFYCSILLVFVNNRNCVELLCHRRGFSSGRNWILFYMFSRHHGLDDSVEFLSDCATRQDWLTLVVFAELFQSAPSKVGLAVFYLYRRTDFVEIFPLDAEQLIWHYLCRVS